MYLYFEPAKRFKELELPVTTRYVQTLVDDVVGWWKDGIYAKFGNNAVVARLLITFTRTPTRL